uniref:Uncharacterized protein n=1 Tax=Oryza meridionalis TaxID=40149 RepID=A0A0E0FA76_9ORYZ
MASPAATMRWVGSRVSVGWSKLCHRMFPLASSMARLPESCSRARAAVALATVEFHTTSPSTSAPRRPSSARRERAPWTGRPRLADQTTVRPAARANQTEKVKTVGETP